MLLFFNIYIVMKISDHGKGFISLARPSDRRFRGVLCSCNSKYYNLLKYK